MTSDEEQVPLTVPALVAASATRHADFEALVDETTRLTYAELLPAVRRAAGAANLLGGAGQAARLCAESPDSGNAAG